MFQFYQFVRHKVLTGDCDPECVNILPGMWKRLFRQPLPLTKNEKRTVDNFFNFLWVCGLPSSTLHRFEDTKTHPYIAITLPTSLELIFPNYSVFVSS